MLEGPCKVCFSSSMHHAMAQEMQSAPTSPAGDSDEDIHIGSKSLSLSHSFARCWLSSAGVSLQDESPPMVPTEVPSPEESLTGRMHELHACKLYSNLAFMSVHTAKGSVRCTVGPEFGIDFNQSFMEGIQLHTQQPAEFGVWNACI